MDGHFDLVSSLPVEYYCYCIAGKVGGEFTLADWRFSRSPPNYNLPNIVTFC